MEYIRLSEGLNSYKLIPITEDIQKYIKHPDSKDYYVSIYRYNEDHYKKWKTSKSIAGVKDVYTTKLVFDFDSKDNLEAARQDATTLVSRLAGYGVNKDNVQIAFSGSKGFCIELDTDKQLTPPEFKAITSELARNLKTFDPVVADPNRIVRVLGTKHQKSGLLKFPLSVEQLSSLPIGNIQTLAVSWDNVEPSILENWTTVKLPDTVYNFKNKVKEVEKPVEKPLELSSINWQMKPKEWKDYKWALLQGFFDEGERHNALMIIAATCRGLGYDKETTYYMCKSALKKQAERTGQEEFDKEELWVNIIEQSVFSSNWNGGQYSIKTNGFLQKYCQEMGFDTSDETETDKNETNNIADVYDIFNDYAHNLDKLTIKFGIPDLDRKMRATVGMSVGLIAGPGVGKSSLAIAALNFMSKSNELCIFFSYDMYHAIVYQKLVQRHFNIPMSDVVLKLTGKRTLYKEEYEYKKLLKEKRKVLEETDYTATFDYSDKLDSSFGERINTKLKEEYANVEFCFTAGQNMKDIEDTIISVEKKRGKKVRFIACDYNELVSTDLSDSTASSNFVAQKMRELAITHSLCAFQLFQPTKISGTPADEIKSYHAAKGGGGISQSVSIMLTMNRPGYSPDYPEDDRYIRINCVKNRLGPLFKVDLGFDGLTGGFTTLSDEEHTHLKAIIEDREKEEETKKTSWDRI